MTEPADSSDAGVTMVELLLTIAIMGIAVVTIVGGMMTAVLGSDFNRKQSDLACPVLEGHRSAALCHLANISYRLGTPSAFEVPSRVFGDQLDAREAFGRFEQHLADNALKLREMTYRLGPRLEFDPSAERFTSPGPANDMLKREYRKPFEMPQHA